MDDRVDKRLEDDGDGPANQHLRRGYRLIRVCHV
jgi:hypothetical protein